MPRFNPETDRLVTLDDLDAWWRTQHKWGSHRPAIRRHWAIAALLALGHALERILKMNTHDLEREWDRIEETLGRGDWRRTAVSSWVWHRRRTHYENNWAFPSVARDGKHGPHKHPHAHFNERNYKYYSMLLYEKYGKDTRASAIRYGIKHARYWPMITRRIGQALQPR